MFGNFEIDVIVVGNLKEKALVELQKEYTKRLKGYVKLNLIELKDVSNSYDEKTVLKKEAQLILKVLDVNSHIVIMDIQGKEFTSVGFADYLDKVVTYENSKFTFVIGGSLGIDQEVKALANSKISFSKLTFPHQLFRIMLLEQLYRAMRIKNNAPYHK